MMYFSKLVIYFLGKKSLSNQKKQNFAMEVFYFDTIVLRNIIIVISFNTLFTRCIKITVYILHDLINMLMCGFQVTSRRTILPISDIILLLYDYRKFDNHWCWTDCQLDHQRGECSS